MCHKSSSMFPEIFPEAVHQTGVKDEKPWKYPILHDPEISIMSCLVLMIMQGFKMYLAAHVFFELQCHVFQENCILPQDSVILNLLVVCTFRWLPFSF